MPAILVTPHHLRVSFTRAEKVLGLVHDVAVERSAVIAVEVVENGLGAPRGLRAPGLGLPWTRKIGTWRRRGGVRSLVSVRRDQPALRIALKDAPYDELVLGLDDAHDVAETLRPR
jgi:hypothetical protein